MKVELLIPQGVVPPLLFEACEVTDLNFARAGHEAAVRAAMMELYAKYGATETYRLVLDSEDQARDLIAVVAERMGRDFVVRRAEWGTLLSDFFGVSEVLVRLA